MRKTTHLLLIAALLAACQGAPAGSAAPARVGDDCAAALAPFRDSLVDLDSRLDVGMNLLQYGERLGDVAAAHGRITAEQVNRLGDGCLATAALLEEALNEYAAASTAWADCIDDPECEQDDVRPTLNLHWVAASTKIEEARARFP